MTLVACFSAIVLSLLSAIGAALLSRRLFFQTEEYSKLEKSYERMEKTVEKKRSDALYQSDAKKRLKEEKSADKLGKELDLLGKGLQAFKMKSGLVSTFFMLVGYWSLNKVYKGFVVLTLPFSAPILVRFFTHRGLPGDDYSQVSVGFVYFMSTLLFRRLADKYIGTQLPNGLVERASFSYQMKEMERRANKDQ